jgi:hypothetical protein
MEQIVYNCVTNLKHFPSVASSNGKDTLPRIDKSRVCLLSSSKYCRKNVNKNCGIDLITAKMSFLILPRGEY